MQIETLKILSDVARLRSFSQAAQTSGVTQSAVSQVVSQLEKRLGVQLVDRSVRPLRMTEAGRLFASGCQDLVGRFQELEEAVRGGCQVMQFVQVAAIYSVGLRDMNQYIEQFAHAQPRTQVRIEYLHPDKVYERVLEGTADLGLVSFPRRTRELTAQPWRDEDMVLVCAPRHPLASLARLTPARLNGIDYVGFDRGLTIRREVDRFLREHDVTVNVVLEFDNIETIKRAVADVSGVALLPLPTLRPELENRSLVAIPLSGAGLVRPLGIIHRRHGLSPAAARFSQILRQLDPTGEATEERAIRMATRE